MTLTLENNRLVCPAGLERIVQPGPITHFQIPPYMRLEDGRIVGTEVTHLIPSESVPPVKLLCPDCPIGGCQASFKK